MVRLASMDGVEPLTDLRVGLRTSVVDPPDAHCDYPILWGTGVIVEVGQRRSQVHFDDGNGGRFPNRLFYHELPGGS